MTTLPGDLVSPVAGWLLRRGAPVIAAGSAEQGTVICGGRVAWEHYAPCDVAAVDVVLDLSDPIGRDIAARWLAVHYGLTVGPCAPLWERVVFQQLPEAMPDPCEPGGFQRPLFAYSAASLAE